MKSPRFAYEKPHKCKQVVKSQLAVSFLTENKEIFKKDTYKQRRSRVIKLFVLSKHDF